MPVMPAIAAGPDIRIEPLAVSFTQEAQRPIYVEIDWMEMGTHSHRPSQAVIDRIVRTFAAAGYAIHIDVSNAIPHQSPLEITGNVAGSDAVQDLMVQYFDHAGDNSYFYSLWGHNYSLNGSPTSSSGIADRPGRVHLVTLGSFSGGTGTFSNQVGTFIHEFGHNLNQSHGGADNGNYKPNYLSVMNYFYQLSGIGPSVLGYGFANTASGFDDFSYSHGLLASLNESSLDENFGIGLGRAVDWNCNQVLESSVSKDIQNSNPCTANGARSVITDFDNWTSVSSSIRALEASGPPETCITLEEYKPLQDRIDALRAAHLLPPDEPDAEPAALPSKGFAARSFLIFNDGGSPLTVSSMSLDTGASWIRWEPQPPFTVAAGASQKVLLFVDFGLATQGQTTHRLLVQSNDPDESPYPGGVNLLVFGNSPENAVFQDGFESGNGSAWSGSTGALQ
jgi:hypothetical protein